MSYTSEYNAAGAQVVRRAATRRGVRWITALALVTGLGLAMNARPAQAQGSINFAPWAGAYVPTRNSFNNAGTDIKRRNAFIGGARLSWWEKSPIGLELDAGYSPANVGVAGATINGDRSTKVFLSALKLMVGVSPKVSATGVYVGAGPALVRRGRDVLQQTLSRTDWGGVAGAGFRIPFSSVVHLRLDAEDFFYGGDFDGSKKFQNDLVFSAGLSFAFGSNGNN